MARRSRAREVAFQVLYQDDLNPRNNPAVGDQLIVSRLRADDLIGFARPGSGRAATPGGG